MLISGLSLGIGLLSLSLISTKSKKRADSKFAAFVVIELSWFASGPLFVANEDVFTQLYVALLPCVFFGLLPCIYWFVAAFTSEQREQLKQQRGLHLLPICVASLLGLSILFMPSSDFTQLFFNDSETLNTWSTVNAVWFALMLVFWFVLSIYYLIKITILTFDYHHKLNELFADHNNRKLNWMVIFLGWLLFTWLYSSAVLVFGNAYAQFLIVEDTVPVLLAILMWLFCFNMLKSRPVSPSPPTTNSVKYDRSALSLNTLESIAHDIKRVIVEEKAYLDPDIDAKKLCEALGIQPHWLSQTFSQYLNTSFYDYINAARIDEAKLALSNTQKNVLNVALDAGFNTRSSFYNSFKKYTGVTPSAYRKKHQR